MMCVRRNVPLNVVFLCYDSDAVDYTENPPFHYDVLSNSLKKNGATDVYPLEAVTSIESWFLLDGSGQRQYLKLPKTVSFSGCKSQNDLCNLFKRANKVYIKGNGCKDLIHCLDIWLILGKPGKIFEPLYKILGYRTETSSRDSFFGEEVHHHRRLLSEGEDR